VAEGGASRHDVVPGSLKARLAEEQRAALKAGERLRLSALRLLSAAVTNREVEVGHPLTDPEFEEVARREKRVQGRRRSPGVGGPETIFFGDELGHSDQLPNDCETRPRSVVFGITPVDSLGLRRA